MTAAYALIAAGVLGWGLRGLNWRAMTEQPWLASVLAFLVVALGAIVWPGSLPVCWWVLRRGRRRRVAAAALVLLVATSATALRTLPRLPTPEDAYREGVATGRWLGKCDVLRGLRPYQDVGIACDEAVRIYRAQRHGLRRLAQSR